MKFLAIIILAMQITGSATTSQEEYEYIGQLPEIVIEAPRYEHEDEAWSGLMPEVVIYVERNHQLDGTLVASNREVHHFPQSFLELLNPLVSMAIVGSIVLASSALALLMVRYKHALHKIKTRESVCVCRKGDQCCK